MNRHFYISIVTLGLYACGGGSGAVSPPTPPPTAPIVPASADLIYHMDGFVFVMNSDGSGVTQITTSTARAWEHVALSSDRLFIVGNVQGDNPTGIPGGLSELWVIDLVGQTESRLLPNFESVGNGGVAWGNSGRFYFACRDTSPFSSPQSLAEFQANAAANDVCSSNTDGSDVRTEVASTDAGEADISVSQDGTLLTFVRQPVTQNFTEIWMANNDGTNQVLVFRSGEAGVASAHDPEFSPDNQKLVFSIVNSLVTPNFPADPNANTAHDIYSINADGSGLRRLSMPGPISIIPDWKNDVVVYTDIGEFTGYIGASVIDTVQTDQQPLQIQPGASSVRSIR